MRQNEAALAALGVTSAVDALRRVARTPETSRMDPAIKAARAQARQARLEEEMANKRTSGRVRGEPAKRYAEEFNPDADAEEASLYRIARKRAKAASGAVGRGARGGGRAVDAALSEEERLALGAAYDEASGWLDEMQTFFTDKLSEANLRNVMKQATALATGAGVQHTKSSRVFRKGQPVTLDEDLVALRAAANVFLRPADDPGHGWRLDHPIGKMGIFQAYLHAKGKK